GCDTSFFGQRNRKRPRVSALKDGVLVKGDDYGGIVGGSARPLMHEIVSGRGSEAAGLIVTTPRVVAIGGIIATGRSAQAWHDVISGRDIVKNARDVLRQP